MTAAPTATLDEMIGSVLIEVNQMTDHCQDLGQQMQGYLEVMEERLEDLGEDDDEYVAFERRVEAMRQATREIVHIGETEISVL